MAMEKAPGSRAFFRIWQEVSQDLLEGREDGVLAVFEPRMCRQGSVLTWCPKVRYYGKNQMIN